MQDGASQGKVDVRERASAALEKTGDYEKAAKLLRSWADKDHRLWRAITELAIEQACYELVRRSGRDLRQQLWNPALPPRDGDGGVIVEGRSLFDSPLPQPGACGKRLGDATVDEVIAAAEFYREKGTDMLKKEAWMRAIAAGMSGKKTVKSVYDAEALDAMREEAKHE